MAPVATIFSEDGTWLRYEVSLVKIRHRHSPTLSPNKHKALRMKLNLLLYASLLIRSTVALENRWTFSGGLPPKHIEDGTKDSICKLINHSADEVFEFDKSNASTCVLHLYTDSHCNYQVGVADKSWWKNASKDIFSFQITDCPNDDLAVSDRIALGVEIGIGLLAC